MKHIDAELEGFDRFWTLWRDHQRKSDGRGKARPAYQQMLERGAKPEDIIDGARWYLRNMTDRDAPYIPLAASWLRSERWADDCEREREYQHLLQERQQQSQNVVPIKQAPTGQTAFLKKWEAQKRKESA